MDDKVAKTWKELQGRLRAAKERTAELRALEGAKRVQQHLDLETRRRATRKAIKLILKAAGIKMSVSGCGCCDSPVVTFEKDGVRFADGEGNFRFDMFVDDAEDGD